MLNLGALKLVMIWFIGDPLYVMNLFMYTELQKQHKAECCSHELYKVLPTFRNTMYKFLLKSYNNY